jgi:hypothetical protein
MIDYRLRSLLHCGALALSEPEGPGIVSLWNVSPPRVRDLAPVGRVTSLVPSIASPRSAGQEGRGGGATRGRVRVAPAVSAVGFAATTTGHTAWARMTTRWEMPYHVPSVVSSL